ncbi:MAG: hypothetical protein WDO15_27795 [Bacteroidota bacterium]
MELRSLFFLLLVVLFSCESKKEYTYKFQDTSLSFGERVDDLVGQMTLDEKVSQMMNASPAIDRLGIPQYNWWSEGLHGVARAGLATVYPQAIGTRRDVGRTDDVRCSQCYRR